MADPRTLDEALDELYGVTPDRFVEVRGELAQRLRDADRPDAASQLEDRRKPTLAAWAVNRTVRDHPDVAEELWAAGDRLRDVGGEEADARDAIGALRDARRSLRDVARKALRDIGTDPDHHIEDVARTLTTAAVVPEQRDQVARGWLVRPLAAAGFRGALEADVLARVTRDGGGNGTPDRRRTRRVERERQRRERHVERLENEVAQADEAVARLRSQLERAEGEADEQRSRLEEARADLEAVESELPS